MVGKKSVPPGPGTFPTGGPTFVLLLVSVILIVGRAHVLPGALARAGARALRRPRREGVLAMAPASQKSASLLDPAILRAAALASLRKLDPRAGREEPGHVRGRGGQRPHHAPLAARPDRRTRPAPPRAGSPSRSASGSGSRCSSPTSPRRWPRGGARPRPTRCAGCGARSPPASSVNGREETVPASTLRKGDVVVVEAGQMIPGDGEVIEGIASVDESAITGESAPGHPRVGRRPLRGHRRHQGPLRPDRGPHHRQPGRVVPRPDDRARRGGRRARRRPTRSRSTSCSSA